MIFTVKLFLQITQSFCRVVWLKKKQKNILWQNSELRRMALPSVFIYLLIRIWTPGMKYESSQARDVHKATSKPPHSELLSAHGVH